MSSPQSPDDAYRNCRKCSSWRPTTAPTGGSESARPQVELIAGSRQSLTSATTPLLHARLRAVTVLLLLVFGMMLVWALVNEGSDAFGTVHVYRNVDYCPPGDPGSHPGRTFCPADVQPVLPAGGRVLSLRRTHLAVDILSL